MKSAGKVIKLAAVACDVANVRFVGNTTEPSCGLGSVRRQQKGRFARIPSETHNRCQGALSLTSILAYESTSSPSGRQQNYIHPLI